MEMEGRNPEKMKAREGERPNSVYNSSHLSCW